MSQGVPIIVSDESWSTRGVYAPPPSHLSHSHQPSDRSRKSALMKFLLALFCLSEARRLVYEAFHNSADDERQRLVSMFEETKMSMVQGDILVFNRSLDGSRSSALKHWSAKWPEGRVPVLFSDSFMDREKLRIIEAMKEMHAKTCIRFEHALTDDEDFLVIVKPIGRDCSSMVGRQGGPQPVRLSGGCLTRKVILHELMHALGFIHEHNRSDRDKYVTIKWGNIKEGEEHNFDKRKWGDLALMNTEYAYDSIMHYAGDEFSDKFLYPTIVPKRRGVKMGGDDRLSGIDKTRINKHYHCAIANPEIHEITTVPPKIITTTAKPIYKVRGCNDAYEDPVENGQCRWLIMRTAADSSSPRHYLHCSFDQNSDDFRCGFWKRKACLENMIYDAKLQFCRRSSFI